jgi:hypothetical protein
MKVIEKKYFLRLPMGVDCHRRIYPYMQRKISWPPGKFAMGKLFNNQQGRSYN